jgi:hypothetical protein
MVDLFISVFIAVGGRCVQIPTYYSIIILLKPSGNFTYHQV